jgi:Na+/citrate or Na+/malate symporter
VTGVTLWLFHAMTVGEVAFVGLYAWTARGQAGTVPWWRSDIGRALMTISLGFAFLLVLGEVTYWTGRLMPEWTTSLGFGLIVVGIYERLYVFGRIARDGRRERAGA